MGFSVLLPDIDLSSVSMKSSTPFPMLRVCTISFADSTALRAHEYYESIDFDLMNRKQISAPYTPNISHTSHLSNFTDDDNRSKDTVVAYAGDDVWCQDF